MIRDLDKTLEHLIKTEAETGTDLHSVANETSPNRISFSVPDQSWRDNILGANLNVYLYDIRENRTLRTNERIKDTTTAGIVQLKRPSVRIDCSYMISAWNNTADSGEDDSELLEHRLLSQVLKVLLRNPEIPVGYLQGDLVNQDPDLLPMISAQKNILSNPVEFWNALGTPYRPSINCVITISLDLDQEVGDALHVVEEPEISFPKSLKEIKGQVVDDADGTPISWAQVSIPEIQKSVQGDIKGNYLLNDIRYSTRGLEFVVSAEGYEDATKTIVVPEPTEDYTIRMTKIVE